LLGLPGLLDILIPLTEILLPPVALKFEPLLLCEILMSPSDEPGPDNLLILGKN